MELNKRMLAVLPCTLIAAAASGQSVDQERAYQSELLADADSRTSLLQGAGGSAGYADGFVISDATGDNTLRINMLSQFRYVWNNRSNDSAPGANDKDTIGFQIPRAWLNFSGNVINKNVGYQIRVETNGLDRATGPSDASGGAFFVSDAFATYKMDDNWTFRWGQFRPALSREGMVDDQYQLGLERSFIDTNTGSSSRVQGIDFNYTDDQFRFWGGFTDGLFTANSDINSPAEADYAINGRFEWMFQGDDWGRFDDFTSFRNSDNAAMAGVSLWYQTGGETNMTADVDVFVIVGDFTWEGDGWNVFAQYTGVNVDPSGGTSTFDSSILVQGGFFFTEEFEAYGAWTSTLPDNRPGPPTTDDNFNTITVGGNYYFIPGSHAAKASADVQIYLDKTTTSSSVIFTPNTIAPIFTSPDSGQFALRLQMQLFF